MNITEYRQRELKEFEAAHSRAVHLFDKEIKKVKHNSKRLRFLSKLICGYDLYINHLNKLIIN